MRLLLIVLLLAGCAHKRPDPWIGKSADELISIRGVPDLKMDLENGKAMTWVSLWSDNRGRTHTCRWTAVLDQSNMIIKWSYRNC